MMLFYALSKGGKLMKHFSYLDALGKKGSKVTLDKIKK